MSSSLSAAGMRAAMRQLQELARAPMPGITVRPTEDLAMVSADIAGPEGTPFEGGVFHVELLLGEGYPEVAPKGYFRTKIFHPNVSEKGEICVNALKRDWSPDLGLRHVLAVVRCLLIEPNAESALNDEAGRLLLEQYGEFCRRAKMMTAVHAQPHSSGTAATSQMSTGLREAPPNSGNANTDGAAVSGGDCTGTPAVLAPVHSGSENTPAGATVKKVMDKKKAALKRL